MLYSVVVLDVSLGEHSQCGTAGVTRLLLLLVTVGNVSR